MDYPSRKHPRLKNYDYSQCGCYHLTFCVKNRRPILSRVIPAPTPAQRAQIQLSSVGKITEHYVKNIPQVYPGVQLIKYAIMPNHVHLLLLLEPQATTSVPTIIRSVKRLVTKELGQPIWQDSFYDVVIRNDAMFQCEWNYIDGNPDKWAEDDLFVAPT